jgi:hypothetical protein
MVTGMRFLMIMSVTVREDPARIAAGKMKRFATECSYPVATKHEMGTKTVQAHSRTQGHGRYRRHAAPR